MEEGQTVWINGNINWIFNQLVRVNHIIRTTEAGKNLENQVNEFIVCLPLGFELTIADCSIPTSRLIQYLISSNASVFRLQHFFSIRGNKSQIATAQNVWMWKNPRIKDLIDEINNWREELRVARHLIIYGTIALIGALRKSRMASRDMIRLIAQYHYELSVQMARFTF